MLTRRSLLCGMTTTAAASTLQALSKLPPVPIIDAHIHLFDPNRPQGVPYRGPKNSVYYTQGAFPQLYAEVMQQQGVFGAIEVEASPWIEDNLWVLETAQRADIIVGVVGNLRPETAEFPGYLERYARNPLFRGIRYGNLWDYDITTQCRRPEFIAGLKLLAAADLVLDSANPRLDLLQALVRINDALPDLRIVIDHLPAFEPAMTERGDYDAVLREIGRRPAVFVKLSQVIHRVNGRVSTRLADHQERLDALFDVFGEDRVLFGSDWPNVEGVTSVLNEVAIMKAYFAGKSRAQQEKYFWRNSVNVYKWVARSAAQRRLL